MHRYKYNHHSAMGITERKEREKQEKKALILEAATKMFLEDGFDKTSLRNIADKIEYSPATIYLYFKDKNELFYAIQEKGFELLLKQFRKLSTIKDPFEKLIRIGKEYLKFAEKNPEYYDLMFIMRAPMIHIEEKDNWDCGMQSFLFLHEVVAECIKKKKLKSKNADMASIAIWSFAHGLAALHIRDRFKNMHKVKINILMEEELTEMMNMMKA
ncbi:MAG: TetR/AcrR family transcriptional regulator [Chitinophagaceae bacterium]|nr:TetR/AcrR family transcriptional regulator [Chitinophagaceae bacterium]